MFLPDENSARTAGLTQGGLFSLIALTVSSTIKYVAGWNTVTGKVPLSVDTFSVFIRADGGVLALVNVPAVKIVFCHRVAGITADEAARGVEAVLTLLTARALLTLVCVTAGLVIRPQVVARQTAAPAPLRVDTNLLLAAVINIRAALVNIPALLAVSEVLVARLAGWNRTRLLNVLLRLALITHVSTLSH